MEKKIWNWTEFLDSSCLPECPSNKCFNINNQCVTLDSENKRKSETDSSCVKYCDFSKCNSSNNICIDMNPLKRAGSFPENDNCLIECNSNECHSNFVCQSLSITNKRTVLNDVCLTVCNSNDCYTDNFICINSNINQKRTEKNIIGPFSDKCKSICDSNQCYDSTFTCVNSDVNNLRNEENITSLTSDKCLLKCDGNRCHNNFICRTASIDFLSPGDGNQCITDNICPASKCHIDYVCINNPDNSLDIRTQCSCNNLYCLENKQCLATNIQTNFKRKSSTDQTCVQNCLSLECHNNFVCIPVDQNNKRKLNTTNEDICLSTCDANTCSLSSNVCVLTGSNQKRNFNSDNCVIECPINTCSKQFTCISRDSSNKRTGDTNDTCTVFCGPNECYSDNEFICKNTPNNLRRKSDINSNDSDLCISECSIERCSQNNVCKLVGLNLKRSSLSNDLCKSFCDNNECYSNQNYICLTVDANNKRRQNNNSSGTNSDLCVADCWSNTCQGSNNINDFVCRNVDGSNYRKLGSDSCVNNCGLNSCHNNFVCVSLSANNLQHKTNKGQNCLNECEDSECFRTDYNCYDASNEFKASNNRKICLSNFEPCDSGRCHTNNFVCRDTDSSTFASSEAGGLCVNNCPSDMCKNGNICMYPFLNNLSSNCLPIDQGCSNDKCIMNNNCITPNESMLIIQRKGKNICSNNLKCPTGQCHLNKVCQFPTNNIQLSDNLGGPCNLRINECSDNSCFRNDIFQKVNNILFSPLI